MINVISIKASRQQHEIPIKSKLKGATEQHYYHHPVLFTSSPKRPEMKPRPGKDDFTSFPGSSVEQALLSPRAMKMFIAAKC